MTIDELNEPSRVKRRTAPFTLRPVSELMELPPPSWLIDGLIEQGVFGVLYGGSGEGKSFLALDWALSIAMGLEWQRRGVQRGPVIYVVAEGGRNINKRIKAWTIENRMDLRDEMLVVMEAIQFRIAEHVKELLRQIDERNLQPELIVIDTLARCFLGGDENSSQDMGEFVEACSQVQRATGATVLTIHHTGKPNGRRKKPERGSYALRAAADVMIVVYQENGVIHVKVDKQKDDEIGKDICLRLKPVYVGSHPLTGDDITSCVLVAAGAGALERRPFLSSGSLATLKALVGLPDHTAESGAWRKAVPQLDGKPIPEKTFQNHRQKLLENHLVEPLEGREHCYRVTDEGTAIANGLPSQRQWRSGNAAATATTPLGVAGGTGEAPEADIQSEVERLNMSEPFEREQTLPSETDPEQ